MADWADSDDVPRAEGAASGAVIPTVDDRVMYEHFPSRWVQIELEPRHIVFCTVQHTFLTICKTCGKRSCPHGVEKGVQTRTAQLCQRGPSAIRGHRQAVHELALRAGKRYQSFEVDVSVAEIDGSNTYGPERCWSQQGDQVDSVRLVCVPAGVRPGESFDVQIDRAMHRVTVPPPSKAPGQRAAPKSRGAAAGARTISFSTQPALDAQAIADSVEVCIRKLLRVEIHRQPPPRPPGPRPIVHLPPAPVPVPAPVPLPLPVPPPAPVPLPPDEEEYGD